jgi:hypothetical protein
MEPGKDGKREVDDEWARLRRLTRAITGDCPYGLGDSFSGR